ncbi:hypothetical protein RRG08_034130 [Elysia crispata]|uniref:Uncharacterized protein n=1 Tax=Elysia crispata TaxID=231223 RepID=A0AAE0ZKG4_9GAST|nr:hypothetical protein RRG08_034130 [Elysia crispata]
MTLAARNTATGRPGVNHEIIHITATYGSLRYNHLWLPTLQPPVAHYVTTWTCNSLRYNHLWHATLQPPVARYVTTTCGTLRYNH